MNPVKLYIIFILSIFHILSGIIVIDSEQIKNIPARDIYDLLSRIPKIHGTSYGRTGQPLGFKKAGRKSEEIYIYIDDIYYGSSIHDLSGICVDNIEKLVIESNTFARSGISLKIYTRSYDTRIPVSEILYKDAFYNYRNLSFSIAQSINQESSFSFSGSILDFMDNRDRGDNYRFPYERHIYRMQMELPPSVFSVKPHIDVTYFRENRYLLDSDSSLFEPRRITGTVALMKQFGDMAENKTVFTASSLSGFKNTENLNIYNELITYFKYGILNSRAGFFSTQNLDRFFVVTEFTDKDKSGINISAQIGLDNNGADTGLFFGINRDLYKQTGISASAIYYHADNSTKENPDFTEGSLGVFKKFSLSGSENKSSLSYATLRYEQGYRPVRDYISAYHSSGFMQNRLRFNWRYLTSASGRIINEVYRQNVTGLDYSDRFFNEKLKLDLSINHRYSKIFLNDIPQTASNLSFNIRARIVNLEFFFGSDNLLKDNYTINNNKIHVNRHYIHQTVEGFDMRGHDEIWGVRWIFFH